MADVSIDSSAGTSANIARGLRNCHFTTTLIGYFFRVDNDGTFGYVKTTDGGATWGGPVVISAATTIIAHDTWFDEWTPGITGTLIHTCYFDSTNDIVRWRSLDTNGDTLGTERAAWTGVTAAAGRGAFCTITVALSGYIYITGDIDAGAECFIVRSTDGGTTWSANLLTTFVEATIDQCLALPAANTGDTNDALFVYQDASTNELTVKLWDSSAAAAVESSVLMSMSENISDGVGQMGFSASIRHSDGKLIVSGMSAHDGSTAHRIFEVDYTGGAFVIVEKTAIVTVAAPTDDHYHPQVFINQVNDDIYVAYNGKRDGSQVLPSSSKVYYTKSTDGADSWSAGDTTYQEGSAAIQTWAPLMGPRFYVGWRASITLNGNFVNSIAFASGISADVPVGLLELAGVAATSSKSVAIPLGAIDFFGVTPISKHASPVPLGLMELFGVSPGSLKTAILAPAAIKFPVESLIFTINVDVPVAGMKIAGTIPSVQKSIEVSSAAIAFVGIPPSSLRHQAVETGLLDFLAITPESQKSMLISVGLLEFLALSPAVIHDAELPAGPMEFLGIAPAATKQAVLPFGPITVTANTPIVSKSAGLPLVPLIFLAPPLASGQQGIVEVGFLKFFALAPTFQKSVTLDVGVLLVQAQGVATSVDAFLLPAVMEFTAPLVIGETQNLLVGQVLGGLVLQNSLAGHFFVLGSLEATIGLEAALQGKPFVTSTSEAEVVIATSLQGKVVIEP